MVEDEKGMVTISTSYFRTVFETSSPEEIDEAWEISHRRSPMTWTKLLLLMSRNERWSLHFCNAPGKTSLTRHHECLILPEILEYCERRPDSYSQWVSFSRYQLLHKYWMTQTFVSYQKKKNLRTWPFSSNQFLQCKI